MIKGIIKNVRLATPDKGQESQLVLDIECGQENFTFPVDKSMIHEFDIGKYIELDLNVTIQNEEVKKAPKKELMSMEPVLDDQTLERQFQKQDKEISKHILKKMDQIFSEPKKEEGTDVSFQENQARLQSLLNEAPEDFEEVEEVVQEPTDELAQETGDDPQFKNLLLQQMGNFGKVEDDPE